MHTAKVYRINTPQVISENIEGEVVIANLQTGVYYSMERVGAELWPWFEKGISQEELVKLATARYAGNVSEIEAGLTDFMKKLVAERLIVEAPPGTPSGSPHATDPANDKELPPFEKPALQSYNDMQDLLLLDPIHDVDEAGWPAKPTQ